MSEDNEKDTYGGLMQSNEINGSCAESCGLTIIVRKNVQYFDLDYKLMKGELRYLLIRLNLCESAEDQSMKLALYKNKRREYNSLIES